MVESNQRKARVQQVKALSDVDFEWLKGAFPEIALTMLRNRFSVVNSSVSRLWLNANCEGWYHMPGSTTTVVMFEKDSDAILFKTAHDGK